MLSFLAPARRALFLGLVLLAAFGRTHAAATYIQTSTGNIRVISSLSEERTTRFLHELVSIRLIAEDLFGTPIFQPTMQVVIYGTQAEMDAIYKSYSDLNFRVDWKYCMESAQEGDVLAYVAEWHNDTVFRQSALMDYAHHMLYRALPDCPYWVREGLSRFLCTIAYNNGNVLLGDEITKRTDFQKAPAKRIPLADTLARAWNSDDIVGLWRMWLTTDYEGNRAKIRRFADLVRQGAPGDADTVAQAFGQSVPQLQESLYQHMRRSGRATVTRPAPTSELLRQVSYHPVTPFDQTIARHLLLVTHKRRPAGLMTALMALTEANPDSPRPLELRAYLAALERDEDAASRYWLEACAKGTDNPFGRLYPLRQALLSRMEQIDLRPSLTPARTAELRQRADAAVADNPGLHEGLGWLAWIEALAPNPQADRVDQVAATHARYYTRTTFLPLVIANIRLQRFDQARELLDEYERVAGPQQISAFLRQRLTPR